MDPYDPHTWIKLLRA